jgi:hypothetical protein
MRRQGLSLMQICIVLNAHGIPTPAGHALWRKSYIDRLLHTRYVQDLIQEGAASLRPHHCSERGVCALRLCSRKLRLRAPRAR